MLIFFHPPEVMRSGSDILSDKTAEEMSKLGLPAVSAVLWPEKWARFVVSPRLNWIPGRGTLFRYGPALASSCQQMYRLGRDDIAWILGTFWFGDTFGLFEELLKIRGIRYIFHLVDDWFSIPSMRLKAHRRIELADLTVAVTPELVERVHTFHPSANVELIEEPVDVDRLQRGRPIHNEGESIIVWTGNPANWQHLESIFPILSDVSTEFNFRLRIVGGSRRPSFSLPFAWEWHAFDLQREADLLAGAAMGLAPLSASGYASRKGVYKVKVYQACGLPVVATDFGHNQNLVTDGETGFLVRTRSEWMDAVLTLLRDRELARKMGELGLQRAKEHFSHAALMPQWAEMVRRYFDTT